MKLQLIGSILLVVFLTISTSAQLPPPPIRPGLNQWFEGWYIALQGDTVKGFIFLSNQIDNQVNFRFSAHPPDEMAPVLDPTMAHQYLVNDRLYETCIVTILGIRTLMFLKKIQSGTVDLFAFYEIPLYGEKSGYWESITITPDDERYHLSRYLIRKDNDELVFLPEGKKFIELISEMLADNAELVRRIKNKLPYYRSKNIESIVAEYNAAITGN